MLRYFIFKTLTNDPAIRVGIAFPVPSALIILSKSSTLGMCIPISECE